MATVPSGQKFHTVPSSVQTAERGSALANSQREIYTMQDVTDTVRPYKVFTALLTQSGVGLTQNVYIGTNYGNTLTIGVSYTIEGNDTTDFTNVGAPNNDVGTSFIATGEVPNNQNANDATYLSYNTGAPIAAVLENTIGNIWFSFSDNGIYSIFSNSLFTENKTYLTISSESKNMDGNPLMVYSIYYNNADDCRIQTLVLNDPPEGSFNNYILFNTPIEIRVYN